MIFLILWAIALTLTGYFAVKRKYDLFVSFLVAFLYLSISVAAVIEVPSENNVIVINVTAP